jgi:hypothetical protein
MDIVIVGIDLGKIATIAVLAANRPQRFAASASRPAPCGIIAFRCSSVRPARMSPLIQICPDAAGPFFTTAPSWVLGFLRRPPAVDWN